jgi:hypothetical protein
MMRTMIPQTMTATMTRAGPAPVAGVDNDITSDDEDDEDQGNAITSGDKDQDEDQDDVDDIDDINDNDDDDDDDDGMPPLLPRTNDDDDDTDSSDEDYDPSDDDSDDDEPDPGDSASGDDASSPTGVPATRASFTGVPPTGVSPTMDNACGPRQREGMRRRTPARSAEEIKEPQTAAHRAPRMAPALRTPAKQQQQADSLATEHMCVHMCGLSDLQHTALTQCNVKRGLEIYGQAASDAVLKEMKQLHDRKTIKPRASEDMTRKEKRDALAYLMVIKEKRSGTIKAGGCTDGKKQRLHKTKQETSSPTVRTESLLLSCVIDAKEGR